MKYVYSFVHVDFRLYATRTLCPQVSHKRSTHHLSRILVPTHILYKVYSHIIR